MSISHNIIDKKEVEKFSKMSDEWWDKDGKFKPLHKLNPVRILYIREFICFYFSLSSESKTPFKNLKILDVGCGGGLISEPMAKLGANIDAIDASQENINIAKIHCAESNLKINYHNLDIEEFSKNNNDKFDVVLALEIIEHVNNPNLFIKTLSDLVKKNGLVFISTLNRNLKSYLCGILGAEYILKWIPIGTHDWKKFFKPHEIANIAENNNLKLLKSKGFKFDIIKNKWILDKNLDVNYISVFKKK